jgi:biopolymer transport protein ExbD
MRVRNIQRRAGEGVELQMTPMIDIVFQLLVFFIMTFKIALPEGDFSIKMPRVAAPTTTQMPEPDVLQLPTVTVRMTAKPNGDLAELRFGDRILEEDGDPSFRLLRQAVKNRVGPDPGPSVLEGNEVELDCDYNLKYANVIEAMDAVSGYVDKDTGQIIKVVEKITFAQPRRP